MLDLMNNPKIMVKRVVNDVCIYPIVNQKNVLFLATVRTICDYEN
jgi:hypothetical protein